MDAGERKALIISEAEGEPISSRKSLQIKITP
jgi:hypothetical protein